MTFLHHLFGLLSADQMKRVNYYFALRGQVEMMAQVVAEKKQRLRELRENHPIEEVTEEDLSP